MKKHKSNSYHLLLVVAALGLSSLNAFAAEGDTLVNVDATKVAPFHYKLKGNDAVEKQGDFFLPYSANLWDANSSGEVWLVDLPLAGSKAIALANTEGKAALQLYNWQPYEVQGNRKYTITAEYLTKGSGSGKLNLEGFKDKSFDLANTGGQWKTITSTFEQKDAAKLTTKVQIYSMGKDNAVYLKSLQLVDNGPLAPAVPESPSKAIAYNAPAIKYVGRWIDRGNAMESTWDTAYLKMNFTGPFIKVKLQGESNIVAQIDNLPETKFDKVSGGVNLTPAGLSDGNHVLRLYVTKGGSKVAGLAVGQNASVSAPTLLPKLIEFVGDSIIAGAGTDNYTKLASDKIGAEHIRLATGAMYLADGKNTLATWMDIRTGIATQYFRTGNIYQTQGPWDFKKYTADAVVINLGQNDNGQTITNDFFIQQYVAMLEKIRQNYPNAAILVMRPFSGNRAAPAQAAAKARNDVGDNKVFFIDTNGWVGREDTNDGVHPTVAGHQKIADKLAPILERVLRDQAP